MENCPQDNEYYYPPSERRPNFVLPVISTIVSGFAWVSDPSPTARSFDPHIMAHITFP